MESPTTTTSIETFTFEGKKYSCKVEWEWDKSTADYNAEEVIYDGDGIGYVPVDGKILTAIFIGVLVQFVDRERGENVGDVRWIGWSYDFSRYVRKQDCDSVAAKSYEDARMKVLSICRNDENHLELEEISLCTRPIKQN